MNHPEAGLFYVRAFCLRASARSGLSKRILLARSALCRWNGLGMNALELVKERFLNNREGLVLAIHDPEAKKVLVAWTMYQPEWKDFEVASHDNPLIVLHRLWGLIKTVDMVRLSGIA